jgi:hypothetical protein
MANLISFKYRNSDTEEPICGLTINYMVQTVAVLANTKGDTSLIPPQRGGVLFSESLLDGIVTTNSNGIVQINVTNMFTDETFLAYFNKFGNLKEYNVSLLITLMNEKQEIGPYVYLGTTEKPQELLAYNVVKTGPTTYEYKNLVYYDVYDDFYIDEVVISEELLKKYQSTKLKTQKEYLDTLASFQGEIESQSILQIPTLNRYNPINITQVITRCLELNVGTIENALSFSSDAGLIGETNRLNGIRNTISQISALYPKVTIDQGEGLPYQNIGIIPEPFRGYSFYQNEGNIRFVGTLMSNYNSFIGDKAEKDTGVYIEYNPSLSLNGEIIATKEWGGMEKIAYSYDTQGWSEIFKFDNINGLVQEWQEKNKLEIVGLVPGDVLTVASYVTSNSAVELCEFDGCKPTTPGLSPSQYTATIVIK